MGGEECACLFFRVLGGRLVVFDRVAKRTAAGLQNGNIEGMVGVRIDVQRNRGAVGPRMGNHLTTAFRRGPVVTFAGEDQGRGGQRHERKNAGRVIGDRGLKALGEVLRRHIAIDGVKHRNTAHRLAEDGDPRRINKFLLSEVAPRRVGVKGLFRVPIAATAAGDAARPQAVDRQRHIALRTKPIGDPD